MYVCVCVCIYITNDTHNHADNHTLTHLGVGVNFIRRMGGTVVNVAVCCSVLQCDAVCCSVLQCVAVCCSVLQCVAVCCSV